MALWMCLRVKPISSSGVATGGGGGRGGSGVRGGEGVWLCVKGGSGALSGVRDPTERPRGGLCVVAWRGGAWGSAGWVAGAHGTVMGSPKEGTGRRDDRLSAV